MESIPFIFLVYLLLLPISHLPSLPISEFEARVNECYRQGAKLHDGYAPFCKHLFIPNFARCVHQ